MDFILLTCQSATEEEETSGYCTTTLRCRDFFHPLYYRVRAIVIQFQETDWPNYFSLHDGTFHTFYRWKWWRKIFGRIPRNLCSCCLELTGSGYWRCLIQFSGTHFIKWSPRGISQMLNYFLYVHVDDGGTIQKHTLLHCTLVVDCSLGCWTCNSDYYSDNYVFWSMSRRFHWILDLFRI